jgi:hypothetical protein
MISLETLSLFCILIVMACAIGSLMIESLYEEHTTVHKVVLIIMAIAIAIVVTALTSLVINQFIPQLQPFQPIF